MNLGINIANVTTSLKQNRKTVVVVFPDEERASWYMENCFLYYTRVIVVSMDGVYPFHPALKENVSELWQDPTAQFVVFGAWCIQDNLPQGNIFTFDKWALELSRKRSSTIQRSIAPIDWIADPIVLARMIQVFSTSQNARNNSLNHLYNVKQENYNWELMPDKLFYLLKKVDR